MSRVRISEHKAKSLIYPFIKKKYQGVSIDENSNLNTLLKTLPSDKTYVLKVDEGIKKRQKNGLITTDISLNKIREYIKSFNKKGYHTLLLEEYIKHASDEEKFIAFDRTRGGINVYYSNRGGINIEDNIHRVKNEILTEKSAENIAKTLGLEVQIINNLSRAFEELYFSFFESNPFLIKDGLPVFLDMAVEVDSTGEFFVNGRWSGLDFIESGHSFTAAETAVKELQKRSSASFKLDVLNPDGRIFAIFSGGGASIVLADEIANLGFGKQLVNYAEYSGNPNAEDTYLFTKNILGLVFASPAKQKVIYIAGGVANFTDIRITFSGIIRALNEVSDKLKKENIKVYVRRGGPHQEEGLAQMKSFLDTSGLKGAVFGPEMILTDIISC